MQICTRILPRRDILMGIFIAHIHDAKALSTRIHFPLKTQLFLAVFKKIGIQT